MGNPGYPVEANVVEKGSKGPQKPVVFILTWKMDR